MGSAYVGRFAPSPSGPLHAGSLVAALASWLDARAHDGLWRVRIEDIDPPRELAGAAQTILVQLAACGLEPDGAVSWQSAHAGRYAAALAQLIDRGLAYRCTCSRRDIELAISARPGWPAGVYPGTCARQDARSDVSGTWRFRVPDERIDFDDRSGLRVEQHLPAEVGDFVVQRADGLWAYQLAVVVDDAAEGITDVVRGADLLDNTPRQIALQRALGLPTPRYLHVPLVTDAEGHKLSKQTGATPLNPGDAIGELERAARHLGLPRIRASNIDTWLARAVEAWREQWLARAASR